MAPEKDYASYLLRLRRLQTGTQPTWVASVQSTATGEQRAFPRVEALATFLLAEFGHQSDVDPHEVPATPHHVTPSDALSPDRLRCPTVDAGWVARPRLIQLLNGGLTKPVTLFSAPAGFGKTVLAGQWLARCATPAAWLTLDSSDNDLRVFLRDLVAAVRQRAPQRVNVQLCPTIESMLALTPLPDISDLTAALVSDFAGLRDEWLLVLDNYQLIGPGPVQDLMCRLLAAQPPSLHLVILSQRDPALPLMSVRAARRIVEMRSADLRFSLDEARALLKLRANTLLDDPTIELLHRGTEGWASALRLVCLALQTPDPAHLLSPFTAVDRPCVGSLVLDLAEALRGQKE